MIKKVKKEAVSVATKSVKAAKKTLGNVFGRIG